MHLNVNYKRNIKLRANHINHFFFSSTTITMVPGETLTWAYFVDISETIENQIKENRILLYMKGSPNLPQCGFSARTVQALMACGEKFAYVDILANPEIRTHLPKYANWPTFPQLWVDGELVGGCDIVTEMHASGELQSLIQGSNVD